MNTLLALTLLASAYGFVVTILLLNQKALRKQAEAQGHADFKRYESLLAHQYYINDEDRKDRDQLAQALKETQAKLDSIKVRRDQKTGRMVSAKSK